jgi:hypothetical protein
MQWNINGTFYSTHMQHTAHHNYQCQPVVCLYIPAPCSSNTSPKQCLGSVMTLIIPNELMKPERNCTQSRLPHRIVSSCNAIYIGQSYNVLLLNSNTSYGNCSPVLILLFSGRISETITALPLGVPPTQNSKPLQFTTHRPLIRCASAQSQHQVRTLFPGADSHILRHNQGNQYSTAGGHAPQTEH